MPAAAESKTFCAGAPAGVTCEQSYPATGAGLQAAIDAADVYVDVGGGGDTVQIDAGFYEDFRGFRTEGGDITIVGPRTGGHRPAGNRRGGPQQDGPEAEARLLDRCHALRGVRAEQVGPSSGAIRDFLNVADVR